jgi:MFS family permease
MADFTVTYTSGGQATLTADRFRESGQWIVFQADGRDDVILSADSVRSIERTDAPPDGPRLDPVSRVLVGVLLLVAGAVLLAIGIVDAFGALTVSGRVLGGAMAAAGLGCVLGALGAFSNNEKGLRRALAASVAALVASLVVLAMLLAGDGQDDTLIDGLALFMIAAGAAAVRVRLAGIKPELPTPLRGFVAAGVIVGLVQFWYTNEYVPASREVGVTELVTLEASPVAAGHSVPEFVTATVTLKNPTGGTKVRVIGSDFDVAFLAESGARLDGVHGRLAFGDTNWLSPGQEHVERLVFRVRDGATRVVRMGVTVHAIKGRVRLQQREPDERCGLPSCSNAWRISETSELRRRIFEARYVVQHRSDDLVTCIARTLDCPNDDSAVDRRREAQKLGDLYGRVFIGAGTELALPPPAEAATPAAPPGSPP